MLDTTLRGITESKYCSNLAHKVRISQKAQNKYWQKSNITKRLEVFRRAEYKVVAMIVLQCSNM